MTLIPVEEHDFLKGLELDPRKRYGARLRRGREALGLSQQQVAERVLDAGSGSLDAVRKALSRAESGEEAPEELLVGLEGLYGINDPTPWAPRDPLRRRVWAEARCAGIQDRKVPNASA